MEGCSVHQAHGGRAMGKGRLEDRHRVELFNASLLSTYYVPGPVLVTGISVFLVEEALAQS